MQSRQAEKELGEDFYFSPFLRNFHLRSRSGQKKKKAAEILTCRATVSQNVGARVTSLKESWNFLASSKKDGMSEGSRAIAAGLRMTQRALFSTSATQRQSFPGISENSR
jgi:hypothetical protein